MQIIINGKDETEVINKKGRKSVKEIQRAYMYGCKDKMEYHFAEDCKSLKEAEEASFFFPNISEQDLYQHLLQVRPKSESLPQHCLFVLNMPLWLYLNCKESMQNFTK